MKTTKQLINKRVKKRKVYNDAIEQKRRIWKIRDRNRIERNDATENRSS